MSEIEAQPTEVVWSIDHILGKIKIVYPPGHPAFPLGETVNLKSFTPTDSIEINGALVFPNNDGVTSANLETFLSTSGGKDVLKEYAEIIATLVTKSKEEALQKAAIEKKVRDMILSMAPPGLKNIDLKDGLLGRSTQVSAEPIPSTNQLRRRTFALEGMRFVDSRTNETAEFKMVLDANGKFDYLAENGILYQKVA